jgi:hypothetical protein
MSSAKKPTKRKSSKELLDATPERMAVKCQPEIEMCLLYVMRFVSSQRACGALLSGIGSKPEFSRNHKSALHLTVVPACSATLRRLSHRSALRQLRDQSCR